MTAPAPIVVTFTSAGVMQQGACPMLGRRSDHRAADSFTHSVEELAGQSSAKPAQQVGTGGLPQ